MEFTGLLLIITVGLLFLSIKIIPQQQMGVVERLGKFNRIMGPGLNFVIPLI